MSHPAGYSHVDWGQMNSRDRPPLAGRLDSARYHIFDRNCSVSAETWPLCCWITEANSSR
jgi:hypothetical protein